jgi:hypothetical protein
LAAKGEPMRVPNGDRKAEWALRSLSKAQVMNSKMSRSEKLVDGLAVAVLVAGFATGVIAKPTNKTSHVLTSHSEDVRIRHNDESRRSLMHARIADST